MLFQTAINDPKVKYAKGKLALLKFMIQNLNNAWYYIAWILY